MPVVPPYANLVLQETQEDSFEAGLPILQYQRVKLTAAGTVVPGVLAADLTIGSARWTVAAGEMVVIRLDHPQNYGLSATLINVGDTVYSAAGGLVTAAAGGSRLGVAKIGSPVPGVTTSNRQASVIILGVSAPAAA